MCFLHFLSYRFLYFIEIVLIFVCLYMFTILFNLGTGEFKMSVSDLKHRQVIKLKVVVPSLPSFNSTCSRDADSRGPRQKVIAYSLYGNFSQADVAFKYLVPLKRTISLIPHIYPGWIIRIYHNLTNDDDLMLLVDDHVDLCNATEIIQKRNLGDLFAMTWRWLPLLDDMVDILLSRDSDSPIVPREKEAVLEWLVSDRIFHLTRDHPAHCVFGPILGGCWGVKVNKNRQKINSAANRMFTINHLQEYDYDQILLEQIIWPIALTNLDVQTVLNESGLPGYQVGTPGYTKEMAHDSYCCEIFHRTRPFPKQRKDRIFVGSRALGPNFITETLSDVEMCPLRCRPENLTSRIQWKFC